MFKRTFITLTAAAALILSVPAIAQTKEGNVMPTPVKSGYAPTNGIEVYYQVFGDGEPIVLLHGGLGSVEMFGPVVGMLAEGHQVIGIDLQAHGRTLPFDRPMSYDAMAEDVAGVLTHLGIEKADVMGYSLGGGTALRLGIRYPEVIDKLILVSTPYAWAGWHDYNQQGMRSVSSAMLEGMKQTPMYASYAAMAPDVNNFAVLLDKVGAMTQNDYDYSAEVKQMKIPTMLVVGDWDAVRTRHVAEFFELLGGGLVDANWDNSGMNQNRLAILPGETHYTIFSSPKLAETALSFIDAQPMTAMTPPKV